MKEGLFLAFATLQALDAYTTLKILMQGGKELNPVMNWIFTKLGTVNGLVLVKCGIILLFFSVIDLIPVWVFLLMIGIYSFVVAHNVRQLYK